MMKSLHTSHLKLEKDGWELLVQTKDKLLSVEIDDLVQIVIVTFSGEYEGEIRSVNYIPLWIKIEEMHKEEAVGKLKTKPAHPLKIKDGTKFQIGDRIFFRVQNIIKVR